MNPTATSAREQARHARLDSAVVLDLLAEPALRHSLHAHLPEHRDRLYPPLETLAMFVSQTLEDDASCQSAVDARIARCLAAGVEPPSASTAAYCQARERLPLALVREPCRTLGQRLSGAVDRRWRWRGHQARLIDGTTFSMPDTPENQHHFPQPTGQKEHLGFPQGRLVGLICARSAALLEARISPTRGKSSDELGAARELIETLAPGTVLVGDALYENYWTLAQLAERGCEGLFEINGSRRRPRPEQRTLELARPARPEWMDEQRYAAVPKTLRVRVVRARRAGGGERVLITTLCDRRRYRDKAIAKLHARRWDVEGDVRTIKTVLGAEVLRCRTPSMVLKELWAHLLGYNLVRALIGAAAERQRCAPRTISFRHAAQLWRSWMGQGARLCRWAWERLLERIGARRVGNRPGRREPRAVKRRAKPRSLLDLPRDDARSLWLAYERR